MNMFEFMPIWLNAVKYSYADNTYRGTIINSNHILKRFGDIELSSISTIDIQSFYNELMEQGYKSKTVRYIHCTFNSVMNYALRLKFIGNNPCNGVILPRVQYIQTSVLSSLELSHLISSARASPLYVPIILSSCLGLRRGEVLGLMYADIVGNVITIRRSVIYHGGERFISEPKTKCSNRHIYVSDTLLSEIMSDFQIDKPFICEFTQNQLNKRFKALVASIGRPDVRFHDLRHIYATLLLSHDVPAKIVSERLGHSSIDITLDLYTHVDLEMQKPSSKVLDYLF